MADLVGVDVVDPFAGQYDVTFPALVTGEEAPVDVAARVLVQNGYREIDADSLHDVAVELGETEHPLSWYAAELARRCGVCVQRPATASATATLDDGVTVNATYTG